MSEPIFTALMRLPRPGSNKQHSCGYQICMGPFKNDVRAKMRFFDPPPSLVTICHNFWFTPSPPLSPVQTVTNYKNHVCKSSIEDFMVTSHHLPVPPPSHVTISHQFV